MNPFKPNQLWTLRDKPFVITKVRDEKCYYVSEDSASSSSSSSSSLFLEGSVQATTSIFIGILSEPTMKAAIKTYPELFI